MPGEGDKKKKKKIFVTDPNDPNLTSYQDSLFLYNYSNEDRFNNLIKQGFKTDIDNSLDKDGDGILNVDNSEYPESNTVRYIPFGALGSTPINSTGLRAFYSEPNSSDYNSYIHDKIDPIGVSYLYDEESRLQRLRYDPLTKGMEDNEDYTGIPALDFKGRAINGNYVDVPIYKEPEQPYQYVNPDSGDYIRQKMLKELGFYKGDLDGIWGKISNDAFINYMKPKKDFNSVVKDNNNLEFVKRFSNPNVVNSIKNSDGSTSTHKMASSKVKNGSISYPTIINRNGKLVQLEDREAYDYSIKTGEFIRFNSEEEAQAFSKNGYKNTEAWKNGISLSNDFKEQQFDKEEFIPVEAINEYTAGGGRVYYDGAWKEVDEAQLNKYKLYQN